MKTTWGLIVGWFVQAVIAVAAGVAAVPPPTPPLPASPVATFRELLALDPAARTAAIASRPARQQESLNARLNEYASLPPEVREDRLRATDLYWHFLQLLRRSPAERASLIESAPADLRSLLVQRLAIWDGLPTTDQQALLQHERAIRYFARIRQSPPPPLPGPGITAGPPIPLRVQAELAGWSSGSAAVRRRVQEQWRQLFEAPPSRTERLFEAMSANERQEMQQALDRFRRLDPARRQTCLDSLARFSQMPAGERAQFLRHAERWETLPPEERAAWRREVQRLPQLPPLPTEAVPPPLPTASNRGRSPLAGPPG